MFIKKLGLLLLAISFHDVHAMDKFVVKYTDLMGVQWSQDFGTSVDYYRAKQICKSIKGMLPTKQQYEFLNEILELNTTSGLANAEKIYGDLSRESYWTSSLTDYSLDGINVIDFIDSRVDSIRKKKEGMIRSANMFDFYYATRSQSSGRSSFNLKKIDYDEFTYKQGLARVRCVRPKSSNLVCNTELKVCQASNGYSYTVLKDSECDLGNYVVYGNWVTICEVGSVEDKTYMIYPGYTDASGANICSREGSRLAAEQLASQCHD